jgi:hypothetical protein
MKSRRQTPDGEILFATCNTGLEDQTFRFHARTHNAQFWHGFKLS